MANTKKLLDLFNEAKEKLGKTEIPEAIIGLVNTTKRKVFTKTLKKDLANFYSDENYKNILLMIDKEQNLVAAGNIAPTSTVSSLQAKFNKTSTVSNVNYAKELDESQFLELYKEVRCQVEVYNQFPDVFSNANILEKFQEFRSAINNLKPKLEAVYAKRKLTPIYNKNLLAADDFIKSYTEVINLIK